MVLLTMEYQVHKLSLRQLDQEIFFSKSMFISFQYFMRGTSELKKKGNTFYIRVSYVEHKTIKKII